MYTNSCAEEVELLKRLWTSQPTICPKCGEVYRTIHMLRKSLLWYIKIKIYEYYTRR